MRASLSDSVGQNYKIVYSGADLVEATLEDSQALGVFSAKVILTKSGLYDLQINLNDRTVPTYLTERVVVLPAESVSAETSTFTGVKTAYRTGETLSLIVTARD